VKDGNIRQFFGNLVIQIIKIRQEPEFCPTMSRILNQVKHLYCLRYN